MNGFMQRLLLVVCLLLSGLASAPHLAAADAVSPWLPGPNAVGDDTYSGFIDSPAPGATVNVNSILTVAG